MSGLSEIDLRGGQRWPTRLARLLFPLDATLWPSPRFWAVVLAVVILLKLVSTVFVATGDTLASYRFVTYWLESGLANPWDYIQTRDPSSANFHPPPFPYPPAMLWILGLFRAPTFVAGLRDPMFSPLAGFSYKLAPFLADLWCGALLAACAARLSSDGRLRGIASLAWHLSTIPLYSTYVQGQLDVIPVAFTVFGVYMLLRDRPLLAVAAIALAVATKHYGLVMLCPIVFWIMATTAGAPVRRLRQFAAAAVVMLAVMLPLYAPYLASAEFRHKVLFYEEGQRVWHVTFPLIEGVLYVFVPLFTLTVVASNAWTVFRPSALHVVMLSAALLTVFSTVVTPMPMWYLWGYPFLLLLACWTPRGLWLIAGHCVAYLLFHVLFEWTVLTQLAAYWSWHWPLATAPYHTLSAQLGEPAVRKLLNICFTLMAAFQLSILTSAGLHALRARRSVAAAPVPTREKE